MSNTINQNQPTWADVVSGKASGESTATATTTNDTLNSAKGIYEPVEKVSVEKVDNYTKDQGKVALVEVETEQQWDQLLETAVDNAKEQTNETATGITEVRIVDNTVDTELGSDLSKKAEKKDPKDQGAKKESAKNRTKDSTSEKATDRTKEILNDAKDQVGKTAKTSEKAQDEKTKESSKKVKDEKTKESTKKVKDEKTKESTKKDQASKNAKKKADENYEYAKNQASKTVENVKKTAVEDYEWAKDQAGKTVENVKKTAVEDYEWAKETAKNVKKTAVEDYEYAKDQAGKTVEIVKNTAIENATWVKDKVTENATWASDKTTDKTSKVQDKTAEKKLSKQSENTKETTEEVKDPRPKEWQRPADQIAKELHEKVPQVNNTQTAKNLKNAVVATTLGQASINLNQEKDRAENLDAKNHSVETAEKETENTESAKQGLLAPLTLVKDVVVDTATWTKDTLIGHPIDYAKGVASEKYDFAKEKLETGKDLAHENVGYYIDRTAENAHWAKDKIFGVKNLQNEKSILETTKDQTSEKAKDQPNKTSKVQSNENAKDRTTENQGLLGNITTKLIVQPLEYATGFAPDVVVDNATWAKDKLIVPPLEYAKGFAPAIVMDNALWAKEKLFGTSDGSKDARSEKNAQSAKEMHEKILGD